MGSRSSIPSSTPSTTASRTSTSHRRTRVALNFKKIWAVALEEYDDFGPIKGFLPSNQQAHQIYAVIDRGGRLEFEGGIGFGLTDASDKVTLKMILSYDFNPKPKK